MEVEFSFTPIDMSFFMADLMITNDSTNAPSLYYGLLGQGEFIDPCGPDFTNCGGQCVDTTTDIDNCGSCGNVCPAVANATAVCEGFTCGFVCDEGYEPDGDGCQEIGPPQNAEELLAELITFIDASLDEGTLVAFWPGRWGAFFRDFFLWFLDGAQTALDAGADRAACGFLNAAQLRCDGGWFFRLPPDFVAGEATAEVHERILEVMGMLDECEPSEPWGWL